MKIQISILDLKKLKIIKLQVMMTKNFDQVKRMLMKRNQKKTQQLVLNVDVRKRMIKVIVKVVKNNRIKIIKIREVLVVNRKII